MRLYASMAGRFAAAVLLVGVQIEGCRAARTPQAAAISLLILRLVLID